MDVRKKIIELYDRTVLNPKLGKSTLRVKLLDGLETVMDQVEFPEDTVFIESPLDRPIDYVLMKEIEKTNGVTARLATWCAGHDVHTCRDIFKHVPEEYMQKGYADGVMSVFRRINGLGPRSGELIVRYFRSMGYPFPDLD